MAELQPPDAPISVDLPPPIATTPTSSPAPTPLQLPHPPTQNPPAITTPTTTITNTSNLSGPSLAPKRQRRPSVRLGDIGNQSYDHSHSHSLSRRPKTWRFHKDPSLAAKTSKTRPLTNLVNGGDSYNLQALHHNDDNHNYSSFDFGGSKKTKSKKPTKRVRTNWASAAVKFDATAAASDGTGVVENDAVFRDENHDIHVVREFDAEGSESPIKEQSPLQSADNQNMGLQFWDRRATRARLSHSESLERHENSNFNLNFNNTINGIHSEMISGDENRSSGVRDWLIGLGLGRYAPVFEIHEVDNEVLPMLTLEDLKDMGINAVGSRRKMYSAILKLRKGFS